MPSCYFISTFASSYTQKWLNTIFIWLSIQIPRKPLLFVTIGLMMTVLCSFGLFNIYIENRFIYMTVPRQSDIWPRFMEYIDQFGEKPPMMNILITTDLTQNILTPSNLNTSYDISNIVYITQDIKYKNMIYPDICLRDYPSSPLCSSMYSNIFGAVFANNITKWQTQQRILNIVNHPSSSIVYYVGGIQYKDSSINEVESATVLRLTYQLQINNADNYEFQKKFDDYWASHDTVSDSNISRIYHLTDRSIDDELNRIFVVDAGVFSSSFIGMLIYLMLLLGTFNCIGFRSWLALSVVLIVMCSFCIGAGIACMLNVELSIVVMLVPYILIGVGVDDMIILCDSFDRYNKDLINTLQFSGLSISLTSLCSFLAFFIASLTPNIPPTVYTFCVVAAISFLALYFIQFFIFVPLMIYDEQRMNNNRNCCCFCYKHQQNVNTATTGNTNRNKNGFHLDIAYILNKTIVPIISYRICRWIIIICFIAVSCLAAYSLQFISTETDPATMVPGDSFVLEYLSVFETSFDANIPIECGIVIENEDVSKYETRNKIYNLFDDLSEHQNVISITNWLQPFEQWLEDERQINILNISNNAFYDELQSFVNITTYKQWDKEIFYGYNEENDTYYIAATRFFMFSFRAEAYDEQWSEYLDYNNIMNNNDINGYVFEEGYGLSYLVDIIVQLTIENMLLCAVGVLCILSLFMDVRIAIFCFLMVVMIDLWLIGWMYIINVPLEPVIYTSLVMAVGLTVDYVIHITVAISVVTPKDKNNYSERLTLAMNEMGGSVLKGALTTLLGGFPLLFSMSKGFTYFYGMVAGIVICSLLHGIILVPALLGEMPFIYSKPNHYGLLLEESQQGIHKQQLIASESSMVSLSTKDDDHHHDEHQQQQNGYGSTSDLTKTQ